MAPSPNSNCNEEWGDFASKTRPNTSPTNSTFGRNKSSVEDLMAIALGNRRISVGENVGTINFRGGNGANQSLNIGNLNLKSGNGGINMFRGTLGSCQPSEKNCATNNELPGIFGSYQRSKMSSGGIKGMTRSSSELIGAHRSSGAVNNGTPQNKNNLGNLVRSLGLKVKQNEIDTKNLTADDLERLKETDPFMYHSIPAVCCSERNFGAVNVQEVNAPTGATMRRSMGSCPAKLSMQGWATAPSSATSYDTKVKRRTRISHEVHMSRIIEDVLSNSDSESEEEED